MGVKEENVLFLDLTKKMFKQPAVFLESMYENNNCSIKELTKRTKIPYKYLFEIVNYFHSIGIVTKYTPNNMPPTSGVYVTLTPKGKDIVNALFDLTYTMKHGKRIAKPHFGGAGYIEVSLNEIREVEKNGRRKQRKADSTEKK